LTQPQHTPTTSRAPGLVAGLVAVAALILAIAVSPLWLVVVLLLTVSNVIRLVLALGSSQTNTVVAWILISINVLMIGIVALFFVSELLGPL